nr:MAG TPA: Major capsid protein [Microviridae sp.]
MANVFNKIGDVKNDVKRNSFDWSHDNNFTTDLGRITPVFTELVPPNSSIRIKPEFGLRFMPMMFPIQTKMKAYLSFFKVPLRTLWKDYMDFISSENTEEFVPPYMNFKSSDIDEGGALKPSGLGDYFGIPCLDMSFGYLPQGSISSVHTAPESMSKPNSNRGLSFNSGLQENYYKGGNLTFALNRNECTTQSAYESNGNCIVFPVPLPETRNYWRFQPLGSFNLSYTGAPHGEPFVAVMKGVAKFGLSGNSALALNPMAYLKKCQSARIVYSTSAGDVVSNLNPQPFTSIGIDSFNNPYLVDESSQTMTVTFNIRLTFSSSTETPQVTFGFVCPPVSPLVKVDESTTLKLVDFSFDFVRFSSVTSDDPISPYYGAFNSGKDAIKISAYPFRAYEAIYNAYIRNTRNNPFLLNGKKTYNRWITSEEGGADSSTPTALMYANWQSDAYTTALTSPQQGIAPLVGLTTYEATTVNEAGHEVTTVNTAIVDEDGNAYKVDFESNGDALKGVNYTPLKAGEAVNMQSLVSPVTSGISINDFRNVNAYQRYLELNQFRGFSYKEIIEGRFDVNVRYDALNMPEYLGGITRDIIVNPITQTVETVDTGAYVGSLGSQAGLATCFGNSDGSISVFCDEESVVMGVMYVMPMPVYDSVLPKWLTYRERLDSFNPEFDHIGYQPIYLRELSPLQAYSEGKSLDTVFGYQRPWYEYVQKNDRAHGLFLSSLRNFIMFRSFENSPELGREFTVMQPGSVNNVFSVTEVSDKILGQIHFDCTAQLPISRVVVPRLE